jgi:D-arabinose 1-dehydrogenase-like Zn-dependent alcohol dehydrogenase
VYQFLNLSSFAERMLVHEHTLAKIRPDMPLDRAALIGCGVTTGVGAVIHTAKVPPGATVAVLGCGGGIGDTTLAFASNGVHVTYIDFPGVCSDFARWRWKEFDCADRVHAMTPEDFWNGPEQRFDAVCSIDVLEHLEHPVRHVMRYRDLLRSGGHLFVTAHFSHSEHNPDHLPENDAYFRLFGGEPKTRRRRNVLTNLGFKRKRWYWFVKP